MLKPAPQIPALRRVRTTQPQGGGVGIDWSNPHTKYLKQIITPSGTFIDAVTGVQGSLATGSPKSVYGARGKYIAGDGSSSAVTLPSTVVGLTRPFTLLICFKGNDSGTTVLAETSTTSSIQTTGGNLFFNMLGIPSPTTPIPIANGVEKCVVVVGTTTNTFYYVDGAYAPSPAGATTSMSGTTWSLLSRSGAYPTNTGISILALGSGADPNPANLSANPWQLFAKDEQLLPAPSTWVQSWQPPTPDFEIDYANPLCAGLGGVAVPGLPEVIGRTPAVTGGTFAVSPAVGGMSAKTFASSAGYVGFDFATPVVISGNFTMLLLASAAQVNGVADTHQVNVAGSLLSTAFQIGSTGSVVGIDNNGTTSVSGDFTKPTVFAATRVSNQTRFYTNGTLGTTAVTGTRTGTITGVTFGRNRIGNNNPVDTNGYLFCIWNRALSDSEIASLSANPFQIFTPDTQKVWVAA